MAKPAKNNKQVGKLSFGKKRKGVQKKKRGPKEKDIKKYRGQGRSI